MKKDLLTTHEHYLILGEYLLLLVSIIGGIINTNFALIVSWIMAVLATFMLLFKKKLKFQHFLFPLPMFTILLTANLPYSNNTLSNWGALVLLLLFLCVVSGLSYLYRVSK